MMNSLIDATTEPQLSIRQTPWMSPPAIRLLGHLLSTSASYLEYGAGGSTRYAASHGVPRIASVESDPRFLKAVDHFIGQDAPDADWHPLFVNLGQTGPLGYPRSLRPNPSWIRYPLTPWARDLDPDLILIDGRFRLACALAAAHYARAGTLVMIDDYSLRPWYWSIQKVMPEVERAGRARVFQVTGESSDAIRSALRSACKDPR